MSHKHNGRESMPEMSDPRLEAVEYGDHKQLMSALRLLEQRTGHATTFQEGINSMFAGARRKGWKQIKAARAEEEEEG